MNALLRSPEIFETDITAVFGRWRRFGLDGPVYEILEDRARPSERGPVVRVRVVETGEELDYRLESLMGDPQER
ncbi:MAG TPA: DUF5397 family protein [Hyphomicrobiaceae bacterium]|nr:DUF5397 family protein [Hyphomicrobiaceae bacterium]